MTNVHTNPLRSSMSEKRFHRYLAACDFNDKRASSLYKANLLLSARLYVLIGVFEIAFRNAIDRYMTKLKGPDWLEHGTKHGGYLDEPGCAGTLQRVQEAIRGLKVRHSHHDLIACLTFGFWIYQFAENEYRAAGNSLLNIFPNRPPRTRQKIAFQNLFKINILRNRIAHYEPVCFDDQSNISTAQVQKRYLLIKEMLYWMGFDPETLLQGIDTVPEAIAMIKAI